MGGRIEFPTYGRPAEVHDEWVVILGGNGTVGQFAIQVRRLPFSDSTTLMLTWLQIACLCGYKVLASCSITQVPVRVVRRPINEVCLPILSLSLGCPPMRS